MKLKAGSNIGKINIEQFKVLKRQIESDITKNKIRELGMYNDTKYYKKLITKAESLKKSYKNFHIVGMGGSFFGAKTIIDGLKLNNGRVNFIYHLQQYFLTERIKKISKDDLVICISKSGETLEVLTILEVILKNGFKNILVITNGGKLLQIAKENKFEVLPHELVSGRFSYLTNVGILPSLLAGFDLEKFLQGVSTAFEKVFKEDWDFFYSGLHTQIFNKHLNFSILMPYVMELKTLTKWYCQLYAESLNRKEFKIMPYPSIGTVDQHSVLEGYLQNPEDKLMTLIIAEKDNVLHTEFKLTEKICKEVKMETRSLEFDKVDEVSLGFLMTFFALETIFIAKFIGINPFNQEMVERRKRLSREGLK